MHHFAQSAAGDEITEYHLQAAITACHSSARDYESTDWSKILSLYDALLAFDPSPVVALNRAIAVANLHGPAVGLEAIAAIRDQDKLQSYHLFHAVLGEFERRQNHPEAAARHLEEALRLTESRSERAFLEKKLLASRQQREIPANVIP